MNGIVFYQGPSMIDGEPIVAIATGLVGGSTNSKTGGMIQTYIMPQDEIPHEAIKSGADYSVCGNCDFRPSVAKDRGNKPCYVRAWQGPRAVWLSWKAGNYPTLDSLSKRKKRMVHIQMITLGLRMGSWGNPSAVPEEAWKQLPLDDVDVRTGYDHNWRLPYAQWVKDYAQASVGSWQEAKEAKALGWSPYLVLANPPRKAPKGWTICPETLTDITCSDCGLCDGHKSIYVVATQSKKAWRKSNGVNI